VDRLRDDRRVTLETYEILDRRFASLINTTARLDLLDATSR